MPAPDLGKLFADLVLLEATWFDAVDERLRREVGMILITLLPLRVVEATENCRVQDLSERLHITVGGASKSVDRLEGHGWVRRAANPDDRRSFIVELTESGREQLAAGNAVLEDEIRRYVIPALTAEELTAFGATIARLL